MEVVSGLSQDSAQHSVMIIDDDKDILSVTSRVLERSGFKIHGFRDTRVRRLLGQL